MRSVLLFAIAALLAVFLYKIVSLFSALAIVMLLFTGVVAYLSFRRKTPAEAVRTEYQGHTAHQTSGHDKHGSDPGVNAPTAPATRAEEPTGSNDLPSSLEMGNYQDSSST